MLDGDGAARVAAEGVGVRRRRLREAASSAGEPVWVVDGDARRERAAHVGDKRRRDERRHVSCRRRGRRRWRRTARPAPPPPTPARRRRRRRRPPLEAEARGGGVDDGGVELDGLGVASRTWRRSSSGSVPAPSPRATRGAAPSAPDARPALARLLTYSLATHRGSAVPAPTIASRSAPSSAVGAAERNVRQPPRCSCAPPSPRRPTTAAQRLACRSSTTAPPTRPVGRVVEGILPLQLAVAQQQRGGHDREPVERPARRARARAARRRAAVFSDTRTRARAERLGVPFERARRRRLAGRHSGTAARRPARRERKAVNGSDRGGATAGPSHSCTKPDWTESGAWRPAACRRRAPSRARAGRPPTRRR